MHSGDNSLSPKDPSNSLTIMSAYKTKDLQNEAQFQNGQNLKKISRLNSQNLVLLLAKN